MCNIDAAIDILISLSMLGLAVEECSKNELIEFIAELKNGIDEAIESLS